MKNNPSFWEDKFSRVMLKIWEWQDSHIVIVEARQPKMKPFGRILEAMRDKMQHEIQHLGEFNMLNPKQWRFGKINFTLQLVDL